MYPDAPAIAIFCMEFNLERTYSLAALDHEVQHVGPCPKARTYELAKARMRNGVGKIELENGPQIVHPFPLLKLRARRDAQPGPSQGRVEVFASFVRIFITPLTRQVAC